MGGHALPGKNDAIWCILKQQLRKSYEFVRRSTRGHAHKERKADNAH